MNKRLKTTSGWILVILGINTMVYSQKPVIEWVSIPAGTFQMGSPASETERFEDELQHQVTLSAFKMSKYEITFAQYDQFCRATGRRKPVDENWGREDLPVINVNWEDANAFALWMGCRLPTEAEWEYAARAGTTTPFYTGYCLNTTQANFNGYYPYHRCERGNYRQRTLPVGSFPPNDWGLYDMYGNVWEWCYDWYDNYLPEPQTDPAGAISGTNRVFRGGSWYCFGNYCRSAYRSCYEPQNVNYGIGFRIVSSE